MTAINERRCARIYIYNKKKIAKGFLYTKKVTLFKKQDKSRSVFIYKKAHILPYAIFHEIFEVGIYIQKAWHFAFCDVFTFKNPDTSQKSSQIALCFYIQKSTHFALGDFSLYFWNWRRGEAFFYAKNTALSSKF